MTINWQSPIQDVPLQEWLKLPFTAQVDSQLPDTHWAGCVLKRVNEHVLTLMYYGFVVDDEPEMTVYGHYVDMKQAEGILNRPLQTLADIFFAYETSQLEEEESSFCESCCLLDEMTVEELETLFD